ncbi:hypothetical protein BDV98DRAFT_297369 [Pterulicium gracile]|uniref:Secreted protein n=1 Tax=Pterulicium gracile TaxID=1884261 RepID=A0A5C3Q9Q3_9AGAR|nr:hypothetical protein BDV98DRAFT_297369 [Pterula gracilis]
MMFFFLLSSFSLFLGLSSHSIQQAPLTPSSPPSSSFLPPCLRDAESLFPRPLSFALDFGFLHNSLPCHDTTRTTRIIVPSVSVPSRAASRNAVSHQDCFAPRLFNLSTVLPLVFRLENYGASGTGTRILPWGEGIPANVSGVLRCAQ